MTSKKNKLKLPIYDRKEWHLLKYTIRDMIVTYIYTSILCLLAFGAEELSLGDAARVDSLTVMTWGQLTISADFTL
jgi:hypothetical protein